MKKSVRTLIALFSIVLMLLSAWVFPGTNIKAAGKEEYKLVPISYAITQGQQNAAREAMLYLEYMEFSRQGLIDQLSSLYGGGYTVSEAEYAMEYLEENNLVDWNEQAYKNAISYIEMMPFSRQGLIDQLTSEYGSQFTAEEAEYAVSTLEKNKLVDWNEQAVRDARSYLEMMAFSKQELINQLSSEYGSKFTKEQAEYAASVLGY